MTLSQLCIKAATQYRKHLDAKNLGCDKIPVEHKRHDSERQWTLKLSRPVFNADGVQLRVGGREVSREKFRFVSVNPVNCEVVLEFTQEHQGFWEASPASIRLISDMKRFVDNVRRWFETNGETLEFPNAGAGLVESRDIRLREEDQQPAVKTVLSAPLSYIFGPPGTGKTRYVLASAVLSHLDEGNRVLILAPTNNALDVAMRGVMEVCQNASRSLDSFLRLGTPSAEFARDFAPQCEQRGIEALLAGLRIEITRLQQEESQRKGLDDLARLDAFLERLNDALRLRQEHSAVLCEIGRLQVNGQRSSAWETKARDIEKEIQTSLAWVEQNRFYLSENAQNALSDLSHWSAVTHSVNVLTRLKEAAARSPHACRPLVVIQDELARLYIEESRLEALTLEKRLAAAQVTGMTLDRYIGDCHDKIPEVQHIFIDEAGFTPLIKALVVFGHGAPVTLLGDHKQLPPVCEMNNVGLTTQGYRSCILWHKSALFCEMALKTKDDAREFAAALLTEGSRPKRFGRMKTGALKYSFRFGPTLAEALSDFVYGEGALIGKRKGNLIVEVVHVAGEPENDKCNIAQAKQAAAIARQLAPNSWAILTPYTNQRDAIKEELARFKERVLTVHAAQGQEWDTVIYCTADSNRNSRFLNETSNQDGKANQAGRECLNTALSRVRMRLILVLDRTHWENRPDGDQQLLSRLIALSSH